MSNIRVRVGQQSSVKVVSSLSGSPALINGITILDEGNLVGVAFSTFTLNFIGSRIETLPESPGIVDINLSDTTTNVIGGIASVTSLSVSGISTLSNITAGITSVTSLSVSGISTLSNIVINDTTLSSKVGSLILQSNNSQVTVNDNLNIVGFVTVSEGIYYSSGDFYSPNGVAYFNDLGKLVSSGDTSLSISETNYVLTTNNLGEPVWSDSLDGGVF